MKVIRKFLLVAVICLRITLSNAQWANVQDSLVLIDIYNSTNGLGWTYQFGWLSGPVQNWGGISLDSNGRVVTVSLHNNNLTGTIPTSIGNLNNLRNLALYSNQLTGSIPSTIGNLFNLQYLQLEYNWQLSGSIPSTIGNLTNLIQIGLENNQLTGNIPSTIGNLVSLQYLDLSHNQVTGNIPSAIGNLVSLQYLDLSFNQLTGNIPSSIGNLLNLQFLAVESNQLTGEIPSSIGDLGNLQNLNLRSNQFTGNIPSTIGDLINLQYLLLDSNHLSGSIPSSIGNLTNLRYLNLSINQLSGNIPNLNLPNLEELILHANQLSGSIPNFNLPNLHTLHLCCNQLTDSIPNFNLPALKKLYLHHNQLAGSIPNFNFPNLEILYLDANQLTGSIPNFNFPNLKQLGLTQNQLTGAIPNFNFSNLTVLGLGSNQLTGSIPNFNFPQLQILRLESNQLTGSVPNFNFPVLFRLFLYSNKLTFDGLETIIQQYPFTLYSPQANIKIHKDNNTLSVTAGGTLSNNTYKWYRNNQLYATILGNPTLTTTQPGKYFVWVTNSIATALTLKSDTAEVFFVKKIDPNPSLITANGTLNTTLSVLDTTKIVNGAATDGITKVLLYSNSASPIRFWISNNSDGSLSSLLNQAASSNEVTIQPVNGKVVAVYNAPDGFGNNQNNQTSRQISIKAALVGSNDSTLVNLTLITPPVVMVHGMWSGPSVWREGFSDYLRNKGFQHLNFANYQNNNFRTFNPNNQESRFGRSAVEQAIMGELLYFRDILKIAITQVDIVAHSLGGLMTRSYSQQPFFINRYNYNKGYIHKLITIGTPHKGSPFGPELWNNQYRIVKLPGYSVPVFSTLSIIMRILKKPIGTCHPDFGIQSPGINALTQTFPYKTFSITANYTGQLLEYIAMNELSKWAFNKPLNQVMASRCTGNPTLINDLIVPLNSQRGFVTGGRDTLVLNTTHMSLLPITNSETNSLIVQNKVARLLLSNNLSEFGSGFPAASSIPLDCNSATERIADNIFEERQTTISNQIIQITSPVRGSTYQDGSGASIVLSFQASGGAVPTQSMFMLDGIGWFPAPENPPYTVSINLPPNSLIGKISVLAIALDSSGLRLADTSFINIIPNGSLDSIIVDPRSIRLDSAIRESSIYVSGYYSNGSVTRIADLTNGSTGTIYSAQTNNIFSVNQDGLVRAITAGRDTLRITNGGKLLKVPVIVDSNFLSAIFYPNLIVFPAIPDKTYGDDPFGLSASASSGDPVMFTVVSGPGTVQNGILKMDTTGQITIKASQVGNVYFAPATDVFRSFCVRPVSPVVTQNCNTLTSNITGGNQWYKDGIEINGATNQSLFITATGTYTAKVASNGCQSVSSNSIVVTPGSFVPTPAITAGTATTFCSGGSVTLTSNASSGNQWYKDGVVITGSTGTTLNVNATGSYTTKVTLNGCESAVSNAIVVTVNPIPPTPAVTAGTATTFCSGGTVMLTSNASSGNQWYKDGVVITGSTSTTLNVNASGSYTTKVTLNGCESAVSNAIVVTVNSIPPTPAITAGTATTFCLGGSVTLTSNASGGNQWYKDGVAIAGSTGTTLNVNASGSYTTKVTLNGCESAVSNAIVVTVNSIPPTPAVTAGTATTFCSGGSVMLTSNASVGNQWYKDGVAITGSTGTTLNVNASGSYTTKVTLNGCESAVSNTIIVTVNPIPPTPTISQNGNDVVSSAASGNQWYLNGVVIAGATGQNYTPITSGNYTVQVTVNGCISAFSSAFNFIVTSVPNIDVFGNQVKVFPNPAKDKLIITRTNTLTGLNVRLLDINGKELKKISSSSSRIEIDMSRYAGGAYIIWVEDWRNKIRGRKVIVKL